MPEVPENERLLAEPALGAALASAAIAFVNEVAEAVNKANHHPDIHVALPPVVVSGDPNTRDAMRTR